ncbi:MAG: response regulator [Bacteroidia bacterium]
MNTKFFIIDDDSIYRMMAELIIKKVDANLLIEHCENGEVAIEKLSAIKNTNDKIIILLDINMPMLDGWNFLEDIENGIFFELNKPLIFIVSSSADESDLIKSQQYSNVKGFLQKPLKSQNIIDLLPIE